jgi:hypothetical protein
VVRHTVRGTRSGRLRNTGATKSCGRDIELYVRIQYGTRPYFNFFSMMSRNDIPQDLKNSGRAREGGRC